MFATQSEIQDYFIREEVRLAPSPRPLSVSISHQVMQRHGNRCIVTGVYDWCRAQRHQVPKASLDYACILPRTARFDGRGEELKRNIVGFSLFTDAGLTHSFGSTSISPLRAGISCKTMRR